MIHSPAKAENKVMVAIKEVNENELPENGTTPSVCLHVNSVHSISIPFTFRTSSACLHVSSILSLFTLAPYSLSLVQYSYLCFFAISFQLSLSFCLLVHVHRRLPVQCTYLCCFSISCPISGGGRAAGKKGWEAGLGQAKTFYTGNKHQSYLFQADSCQTEIVK